LRKLIVSLTVVAALVLMAGTTLALADCGSCGAPAKAGCPMKAGTGHGMQMGAKMGMGGGCGMMGKGHCRVAAKTHALTTGQATLAATPHGLLLNVTDRGHQGDANASVSAYGLGPDISASLKPVRLGPGRYALKGDLDGLSEVAVRVTRGAASEVVYFGLQALASRAGSCQRATCPCGASCKCASGDHSNCKCGADCKCASCGKAAAGTCPTAGGCAGGACPKQKLQ
ncbi:MAG: hypothetical protein KKI08_10460, partial [Armatimonadetes bacterium]|nr:hypothetical protein [Armatimonadota bacterium]